MLKILHFTLTSRQLIIILTFLAALILPIIIPSHIIEPHQLIILIMTIWMVLWWACEIVSIPITSLIPLIILPLYSVEPLKSVASHYAHPLIFLFLGGFIIAASMERWNLHKRIALHIIYFIGRDANTIIGGFMISTAFLSMWISNTATTVMMLPIGLAIISLIKESEKLSASNAKFKTFSTALMLSIAYAANIGGTATLIGTPPNTILAAFLVDHYQLHIGFAEWIIVGLPFACVMLFISWLALTKILFVNHLGALPTTRKYIHKELKSLGPLSYEEKWIAIIFSIVALLWMVRPVLDQWIGHLLSLNDTSIVLSGVLILSLIPSQQHKKTNIIDWPSIVKMIPWGILLLFGGGLTIAYNLSNTSLVQNIGDVISSHSSLYWWVALLLITAIILLFTELMSNMALTTVFLPIAAVIALNFNHSPITFLVPITIAASCAFMMPVATPPNAIVFGSGHVLMKHMIKAGLLLNFIGISLIFLIILPLSQLVLVP